VSVDFEDASEESAAGGVLDEQEQEQKLQVSGSKGHVDVVEVSSTVGHEGTPSA
jgi:hypothetical protein